MEDAFQIFEQDCDKLYSVNTRRATSLDSFVLSSLSTDVQRLHAEHYPDIFKIPEREDFAVSFFEEMLADPAVWIFIAEEEGRAVGCIVCKLVERPENPFTVPMRYLLVDQITVRPDAGRKGVGDALMKQAESLAGQLDVQRVQLDSWGFNLNAHAFFEHMGYQKFNFRFWKWLE
jgi:ribosomal protein S18 acetylase RimI-like enzyme